MALTIEKCIEGWTNTLKQLRLKTDVVFYGDSLTYYGDFSSIFPEKTVCNLGLRGDTIQGLIDRIEQVEVLKPNVVFLMIGINDVALLTAKKFGERYEILIHKLQNSLKGSQLIIQSILPVNDIDFSISCNNEQIVKCNAIVSRLAHRYGLQYIDLFTLYQRNSLLPKEVTVDGIHIFPFYYEQWYQTIRSINL